MAIALPLFFTSCSEEEPKAPDDHEYVDLGLPSGTLWATCNVGANAPEEYGYSFAWGETAPKEFYNWKTYKWCNWVCDTISEYYYVVDVTWYKYFFKNWENNVSVEGDCKIELEPEDDAASVNWGAHWCMPTLAQMAELIEKCDWQWTQVNGVNGDLVTGPNGKSIFLPAAGGRESDLYNDGICGYYWSRSLCSRQILGIEAADQHDAYIMFFKSKKKEVWYDSRYCGNSVRPVRTSHK